MRRSVRTDGPAVLSRAVRPAPGPRPLEALLVGVVAGALVVYAIELLELRLKIDDPAGAISVHGIGGLWGLLAAGILNGGAQSFPSLSDCHLA